MKLNALCCKKVRENFSGKEGDELQGKTLKGVVEGQRIFFVKRS